MSQVRVFVGIHPSDDALDNLQAVTRDLSRWPGGHAARWVPRDNMHLTAKFLGDVASESLPGVYAAVGRAVAQAPCFVFQIADLGCFPNTRRPNIVWAGVRGELGALRALQQAIEAALEPLGYPREARPYSPHLTIGRVNQRASPGDVAALGRTIAAYGPVALGEVRVGSVSVIRSDLRPSGPVYTDLWIAPLQPTE